MKYRILGDSDLKVSAVGLGTWAYGNDTFGAVEDQQAVNALRAAVDFGINLIDTAPAYGDGRSEIVVGKAIEGIRDKIIIVTKCGVYRDGEDYVKDLSPSRIRKDIELSLSRLNIEQIDLYQIHWPDPETPLEKTVEELLKLKKEGKFKYLGVSNFDRDLLAQITNMTDIISLQPQYSLLERKLENEILSFIIEKGMGILSYGTLGGGILSGKYTGIPDFDDEKDNRSEFYTFFKEENWPYIQELINLIKEIATNYDKTPAQISINWSISRPGITTALVGAKTEKQAQENALAADFQLADSEIESLTRKSNKIINQIKK
jgi:aryl-alcohol dehydrogenase-like predicted oxidoreductase